MPRYIIKLTDKESNDYYLEWSTIVDAPVTYGIPLEEFKAGYIVRYGTSSKDELDERLQRVEKTGCSAYDETLDELISYNRAGEDESSITKEEILERFCLSHVG